MNTPTARKSAPFIIPFALAIIFAIPMISLAQGRGNGKGGGPKLDKKCAKFVNCHDARDGRWDGRGPQVQNVNQYPAGYPGNYPYPNTYPGNYPYPNTYPGNYPYPNNYPNRNTRNRGIDRDGDGDVDRDDRILERRNRNRRVDRDGDGDIDRDDARLRRHRTSDSTETRSRRVRRQRMNDTD